MSDQPQPLTDEELAHVRRRLTDPLAQPSAWEARLLAEVDRIRAEVAGYRSAICFETTCTNCAGMLDQLAQDEAEADRLRAENTAQAERIAELTAVLERPNAEPDEEFDAVREAALKWKGGRGVKALKDLIDAFDWLRSELAYAERIKSYVRKQHTDLEGAFDLVIKQCGKLRAERDSLAASLDQFNSFPTEPGPGEWSTGYRMGYADAGKDVRALARALGVGDAEAPAYVAEEVHCAACADRGRGNEG